MYELFTHHFQEQISANIADCIFCTDRKLRIPKQIHQWESYLTPEKTLASTLFSICFTLTEQRVNSWIYFPGSLIPCPLSMHTFPPSPPSEWRGVSWCVVVSSFGVSLRPQEKQWWESLSTTKEVQRMEWTYTSSCSYCSFQILSESENFSMMVHRLFQLKCDRKQFLWRV